MCRFNLRLATAIAVSGGALLLPAIASAGNKGSKSGSMSSGGNHNGSSSTRSHSMTFSMKPPSSSMQMSQGNGNFNKYQFNNQLQNNSRIRINSNVGSNGTNKYQTLGPSKKFTPTLSNPNLINRSVLNQRIGVDPKFKQTGGITGNVKKFPTIDPGIGNGKTIHDDHHGDHHHHADHHHDHHHHHHNKGFCHWGPWVIGIGLPKCYPYPYPTYPYPYPVPVPVGNVTINSQPQGGPKLVDGTNLQLVDVRLVDTGNASKNLGPKFLVVIGNNGKQSAGNFQLLAMAAKDEKLSTDLPSTTVEVDGIEPGQIAKLTVRLPLEAMTVTDGNPFNLLAVIVDSNKLIDEVTEDDNVGMVERTKILSVDSK
jgi:hypothetical protein